MKEKTDAYKKDSNKVTREATDKSLVALSRAKDIKEIERLIKTGADPNATDEIGVTALMVASGEGYIDIAQLLLKNNADINKISRDGMTALDYALISKQREMAAVLLEHNPPIDRVDSNGRTPLMWAATQGYPEIVETLIRKGADVNMITGEGIDTINALHLAKIEGHTDIVNILHSAGSMDIEFQLKKEDKILVTCESCKKKNRIPDRPQQNGQYTCGFCGNLLGLVKQNSFLRDTFLEGETAKPDGLFLDNPKIKAMIEESERLLDNAFKSKVLGPLLFESRELRKGGSLIGFSDIERWIYSWHPQAWLIVRNCVWQEADIDTLAKQISSNYKAVDKDNISQVLSLLKSHVANTDSTKIDLYLCMRLVALCEEVDLELYVNKDNQKAGYYFPIATSCIRDIGNYLLNFGGFDRMVSVCSMVATCQANARLIEQCWSGIGQWRG